MEREAFDRMAELDGTHWWYLGRRRILSDLISRYGALGPDARILEIGCGTGHNLAMLAGHGRVDAVELDDDARALASRRLGRPVLDGKLPDIADQIETRYDLVTLLDVLEHIPDDKAALAGTYRLMKPGGKLLLTIPANPWMWTAHDAVHHHHRRYRKAEIAKLARGAGFTIDLLTPFNTLLYPAIAAVRLVRKARGKQESDDRMPPAPVNRLLDTVFGAERALIGRVPFPFGVSLAAVLSRPA